MPDRFRRERANGAPGRRRRLSARERREVIVEAAERVFAQLGYHRASLDQIAHAAGVSKALIYEHFASKRDLHSALLAVRAEQIFARLQEGARRGGTCEERLRDGIDAFLAFVEEHRDAWRVLWRDPSEPDAVEVLQRIRAEATSVVASLLAGEDRGGHGDHPPADDVRVAMHAQLLTGAVGSLATWWDDHRDVPRDVLVERAMTFCWPSVAAPGERPETLRPRRR